MDSNSDRDPLEPTNEERAARIDAVMQAYLDSKGELMGDPEEEASDLVCDILHWLDREKVDPAAVLRYANSNHEAERDPNTPKPYTVIATWQDVEDISDHYMASGPKQAVRDFIAGHDCDAEDLTIVAVLDGHHQSHFYGEAEDLLAVWDAEADDNAEAKEA